MDGEQVKGFLSVGAVLMDIGGCLMSDSSETPHTLSCSEVWGGNREIFRSVQLPSVTAWVASVPLNEGERGGDLHYMSVCDHDLISASPWLM